MFLHHLLDLKASSPPTSRIRYPRCSFSGLVHKYKCNGPQYYLLRQDCEHHHFRVWHIGIPNLAWKNVKDDSNQPKAIQEHLLCCNYSPSFSILTMESNDLNLKTMESLLIAHGKTVLNKIDSSLVLELFCCNIGGYPMILYEIIWCPSILLCTYNCCLVIFQYHIKGFSILLKQNLGPINFILSVTMNVVPFER